MPINLAKTSDFFTAAKSRNRKLVMFLAFPDEGTNGEYFTTAEHPIILGSAQHGITNSNIVFAANAPMLEDIDVADRQGDSGTRTASLVIGSGSATDTDGIAYRLRNLKRGSRFEALFGYWRNGALTDLVKPFSGSVHRATRRLADGAIQITIEIRSGVAGPNESNPVSLTEYTAEDNAYQYTVRRVEGRWGAGD